VFAGREATACGGLGCVPTPSIEIVARDRAGAYSVAAAIALPAAIQVADRWHLLGNLRDNVERLLHRRGPANAPGARQQVVVAGVTRAVKGRGHNPSLLAWLAPKR